MSVEWDRENGGVVWVEELWYQRSHYEGGQRMCGWLLPLQMRLAQVADRLGLRHALLEVKLTVGCTLLHL